MVSCRCCVVVGDCGWAFCLGLLTPSGVGWLVGCVIAFGWSSCVWDLWWFGDWFGGLVIGLAGAMNLDFSSMSLVFC